jgi:hypothetical protein
MVNEVAGSARVKSLAHAMLSSLPPFRSTTNPGKVPTFKIGDAAARTVYNRSTLADHFVRIHAGPIESCCVWTRRRRHRFRSFVCVYFFFFFFFFDPF